MQAVDKIWYRVYYWVMLSVSSLFVLMYGLLKLHFLIPQSFATTAAINGTTAALAGLHILYSLIVPTIAKHRTSAFALLSASLVFSLMLMNGLSRTGADIVTLIYAVPWIIMGCMNGMFGLPFSLFSVFLTTVLVAQRYEFQPFSIPPYSIGLVVINAILAFLCYKLWKPHYQDIESQRIQELTSSLGTKEMQSEILIKAIADGIVVVDTTGKIITINPAAAQMTGWAPEDSKGIDVRTVVKLASENKADAASQDIFSQVLTKGAPINQSFELSKREGTDQLIVSMVASPIVSPKDNKIVGAVAVFRDISAARKEEAQRAEFISTASHEMRTPVAAIEGYLALALNEKVSKIDSHAREYLEKAHSSTQHLGKLFQDLLTSAKAEDGRLTSHPVIIEVGSYLQQVTNDLQFAAQKKGMLTEFILGATPSNSHSMDASTPGPTTGRVVAPLYYVYGDPDRLREVITNLFDNAVKYSEKGKISIGLTGDTNVVQMRVSDQGPGIPKEDLSHLFQKFYRVDNSATRTIGGTGLGLFICRKIVELYGGRIWAESELGKGSTFYINLPRVDSAHATALQQEEANKIPAAPLAV